LEGFKKLPDETDCEEQNLPQNCFPSTSSNVHFTSYIMRKPSHKVIVAWLYSMQIKFKPLIFFQSQSMDYMVNATVSENDDTSKKKMFEMICVITSWSV
jgi:hypothetical protein